MRKFIAMACAALLLASCAETPLKKTMTDMSFDKVQPVALDVGKIEVSDQYKPPMQKPNVEHLFKPTPVDAVTKLLNKALVAEGAGKTLRVIIDDASVVDEPLPMTDGFWGNFTQEPSDRYKAKVSLRFQLVDDAAPDIILGHAEVIASRNRTLLKGTTLADRDKAAYDLTAELMSDVDDGLQTIVENTFGKK